MKTLSHILGKRSPAGYIGIEVETEAKRNRDYPAASGIPTMWSMKTDGSLRGGYEFVVRRPIKIDDVDNRVNSLMEYLGDCITDTSMRTSTHVHISVLNSTPIHLVNQYVLYHLVEEALFEVCGEERKVNSYATRFYETSSQHIQDFREGLRLLKFSGVHRYRSFNMAAINRYGSIEYRGMRGCTQADEITKWVKTLHNIQLVQAPRYKSPITVLHKYDDPSDDVRRAFIKRVIGSHYDIDITDEVLARCDENAMALYEFAFQYDTSEEWIDWAESLNRQSTSDAERDINILTNISSTAVRYFNNLYGD